MENKPQPTPNPPQKEAKQETPNPPPPQQDGADGGQGGHQVGRVVQDRGEDLAAAPQGSPAAQGARGGTPQVIEFLIKIGRAHV